MKNLRFKQLVTACIAIAVFSSNIARAQIVNQAYTSGTVKTIGTATTAGFGIGTSAPMGTLHISTLNDGSTLPLQASVILQGKNRYYSVDAAINYPMLKIETSSRKPDETNPYFSVPQIKFSFATAADASDLVCYSTWENTGVYFYKPVFLSSSLSSLSVSTDALTARSITNTGTITSTGSITSSADIKGATMTSSGLATMSSGLAWGSSTLSTDQGGSIELKGTSASNWPYIDFKNKATDYDARISLNSSQKLEINVPQGILFNSGKRISCYNDISFDYNFGIGMNLDGLRFNLPNQPSISIGRNSLSWYNFQNQDDGNPYNGGENSNGDIALFSALQAIRFYTNANNQMTITSNGDVNIANTLRAKEVHIENFTLPDYVFAKDYKLRSLNEVESYVKENNHLPEVPSAAEVAKNGQSVNDMQNTLLKKVEELTLYIIDQEKRISELEKQNAELRKR